MKRSLFALCTVELLERFAFYALLTTVMLYLTEQRGMDDHAAASLFQNFVGLLYLVPLLGAVLADRLIGQLRATILGAVLLTAGYALLIFHESGTFYVALCTLSAGYGLFKPTIPAVLANRYPRLDTHRETAFIVFYLAIQLGAFLAPLGVDAARVHFGWTGSFATSAAAMTLAVLVLLGGRRSLSQVYSRADTAAEPPTRWSALIIIYLICTLHAVAAASLTMSLPLFVREHVDLTWGGRFTSPIPRFWFEASPLVFQALLAPPVILGLLLLRRRRVELSLLAKVGIGMVLVVLPCLLMVRASLAAEHGVPVSMLWVLGAYLAAALPSLCLTPLVMVLVSQLVPRRHLSTAFALWFIVTTMAQKIAVVLMRMQPGVPEYLRYGGLGLLALLATGLWISQIRRLEAARQV